VVFVVAGPVRMALKPFQSRRIAAVIRNGLDISGKASKNGAMSPTRSFSTGSPRIGSIVMGSCCTVFREQTRISSSHRRRARPESEQLIMSLYDGTPRSRECFATSQGRANDDRR